MNQQPTQRGRQPADFETATAHLRPELLAHCYRLLGSLAEAEDRVQETYLRAWKSFHSFENRSSVRTWMYTIATNTCLTALKSAPRRPLPSGLGAPPADPQTPLVENRNMPWLEPLPDAVLWGKRQVDPAEQTVAREGVSLAFTVALQELPPRQRAVLVLRDVLQFEASQTADVLQCSVPAVNSALQRARHTMADRSPRAEQPAAQHANDLSDHDRKVLADFIKAFEEYDIAAAVETLAADAVWEMPPFTFWYQGAASIRDLVSNQCPASGPGSLRLIPTMLNGQPAAGMYLLQHDDTYQPFQILLLEMTDGAISHVVGWFEPWLFEKAGLPLQLSGPGFSGN